MKLEKIVAWLDAKLDPGSFDDVSNNGVQIARRGADVKRVAFGVDASAAFIRAAAEAGAQLCVVHHGISWGGGVKRISGGVYEVVKAAMDADIALYASHLPLDANRECGNNREIARFLGLTKVRPAFSYHGNVIGVVGVAAKAIDRTLGDARVAAKRGEKIGICSGGAGEFAEEAKALGCGLYVTGEASWGDVVAAQNAGMRMVCAGHYETETFGVRALATAMSAKLPVGTAFLPVRP